MELPLANPLVNILALQGLQVPQGQLQQISQQQAPKFISKLQNVQKVAFEQQQQQQQQQPQQQQQGFKPPKFSKPTSLHQTSVSRRQIFPQLIKKKLTEEQFYSLRSKIIQQQLEFMNQLWELHRILQTQEHMCLLLTQTDHMRKDHVIKTKQQREQKFIYEGYQLMCNLSLTTRNALKQQSAGGAQNYKVQNFKSSCNTYKPQPLHRKLNWEEMLNTRNQSSLQNDTGIFLHKPKPIPQRALSVENLLQQQHQQQQQQQQQQQLQMMLMQQQKGANGMMNGDLYMLLLQQAMGMLYQNGQQQTSPIPPNIISPQNNIAPQNIISQQNNLPIPMQPPFSNLMPQSPDGSRPINKWWMGNLGRDPYNKAYVPSNSYPSSSIPTSSIHANSLPLYHHAATASDPASFKQQKQSYHSSLGQITVQEQQQQKSNSKRKQQTSEATMPLKKAKSSKAKKREHAVAILVANSESETQQSTSQQDNSWTQNGDQVSCGMDYNICSSL